jgi:rhodanese-related sulfurtransferase
MKALALLKGAGFARVRSLAGGIDAWADRIEVGMPRY